MDNAQKLFLATSVAELIVKPFPIRPDTPARAVALPVADPVRLQALDRVRRNGGMEPGEHVGHAEHTQRAHHNEEEASEDAGPGQEVHGELEHQSPLLAGCRCRPRSPYSTNFRTAMVPTKLMRA